MCSFVGRIALSYTRKLCEALLEVRTFDLLRKSVRQGAGPLHPERPTAEPVAIYHLSTKSISRSAGRSAVAASAYRAGVELLDERTGEIHDYRRKQGVASVDLITPDGQPVDRGELWNAAESAEKRKDARIAREWVAALPSELDAAQRRELAKNFGRTLALMYGVAVEVAIHAPDREGDQRNHHAHLMTTTRRFGRSEAGRVVLGEKAAIELSDTKRRAQGLGGVADEVKLIRSVWEKATNRALERAGVAERVDARSLRAQGVDAEPTTHLGPVATAMERRGVRSDRGDVNRVARGNTAARAALRDELEQLGRAQRAHELVEVEQARQAEAERRAAAERQAREAERRASAESIERMSAEDLRREISQRRPAPVGELLARDPMVRGAESVARSQRESEAAARQIGTEAAQQAARWRQEHPMQARLHDAGVKRSAYLDERAQVVEHSKGATAELRSHAEAAEAEAQRVREAARQRIGREQAPLLAELRRLEELQRAKQEQEREAQQRALDDRQRDEVRTWFAQLIDIRERRVPGCRDGDPQWQQLPAGLREEADRVIALPEGHRPAAIKALVEERMAAYRLARDRGEPPTQDRGPSRRGMER